MPHRYIFTFVSAQNMHIDVLISNTRQCAEQTEQQQKEERKKNAIRPEVTVAAVASDTRSREFIASRTNNFTYVFNDL